MKALLLSDYFYPFTPGGSEWSVYELAKALQKNKAEVSIVTINYGSKKLEIFDSLKIFRIPFFKKLKERRSVVNPIWQNNPLFFLASAYFITRIVQSEKADVINVHGKFLIPGGIIAGWLTKKPVIVTIRDKQLLCSIGKCFFDPKRYKACNFWEYLTLDFPWFIQNYTNRNVFISVYVLCGVIWSKLAGEIIKFFAKKASIITTISNSQKKYLESNGFENVEVIYNTANFEKPNVSVSKSKAVLFVGKLSKGKGIELLLDAAEKLLKKNKIKFIFAGSVQSSKIKKRLEERQLKPHIELLGGVNYRNLPSIYKRSSVLVMPSIYPESFGRSALEALSYGTPVVVTNTGALPEIVDDKITGRIVKTDPKSLKEALLDVMKNENRYRSNIATRYKKLKRRFMENPVKEYISVYNSQIK